MDARYERDAKVRLFRQKAAAVATTVVEAADNEAALAYALNLCMASRHGGEPTLAAPGLEEAAFAALAAQGAACGVRVLREGLRGYPQGVDVGFSTAAFGIAETATLALASTGEEERLASMLCDRHVVALPKAAILNELTDAEAALRALLAEGAAYAAFISGCSRTSDIERVLTLGVHGPLELHVVLTE